MPKVRPWGPFERKPMRRAYDHVKVVRKGKSVVTLRSRQIIRIAGRGGLPCERCAANRLCFSPRVATLGPLDIISQVAARLRFVCRAKRLANKPGTMIRRTADTAKLTSENVFEEPHFPAPIPRGTPQKARP